MGQAPGSINNRSKSKSHSAGCTHTLDTNTLFQGPDPTSGTFGHADQPIVNEEPIFILERDHIRNGCEGHKIAEGFHWNFTVPKFHGIGLSHFIG